MNLELWAVKNRKENLNLFPKLTITNIVIRFIFCSTGEKELQELGFEE